MRSVMQSAVSNCFLARAAAAGPLLAERKSSTVFLNLRRPTSYERRTLKCLNEEGRRGEGEGKERRRRREEEEKLLQIHQKRFKEQIGGMYKMRVRLELSRGQE